MKEAGAFRRVRQIGPVRIYPEQLARRARELVLMLRPSMARELEQAGVLPGSLAIWSMWRGYLEGPSEQSLQQLLKRHGVPLEVHHVSGHAYVSDLRRLVDVVRPVRVIPIHTSAPHLYARTIPGTEAQPDGAWWTVERGSHEDSQ